MAGSTGEPIGPFPTGADPVEYDKLRRRVLWTMPSGLYVVGSRAGRAASNLMTANWVTQVSLRAQVGGGRRSSTKRSPMTLIRTGGVFSLSVLDREDRPIVRKFVKPVDVDVAGHTLNGFAFRLGHTGAPILEQAVAWLDCEVRQEVEVGGHTLFVGEVVDCGFSKGRGHAGAPHGGHQDELRRVNWSRPINALWAGPVLCASVRRANVGRLLRRNPLDGSA